jgi:hypothetical protein
MIMTLKSSVLTPRSAFENAVLLALLWVCSGAIAVQANEANNGVQIWDTLSSFGSELSLQARSTWKPVPADLLTLELDPDAASSDPSYYGRGYSFRGDVVVENQYTTAVFWSEKGSVLIYSKADPKGQALEFVPRVPGKAAVKIAHCAILQNTGDEIALDVLFSVAGTAEPLSAVLTFDRTEIVGIKPGETMMGVRLLSPTAYGIVPSFIGDDLIFNPSQYPRVNKLHIPMENLFLGLLEGGNSMLVLTCDQGRPATSLFLEGDAPRGRYVKSIDLDSNGKSIYVALLHAPGIWHRESLQPSYLEKDVRINWKKPFAAKWVTQLLEAEVPTTFSFRESKGKIWRGVIGAYIYPVWFSNENTFYRLSKKIPPQGESLIYFLERGHTPASVTAPVDILKATLGRHACDAILDLPGRTLRSHHRRAEAGIRRACTCGCTAAIEAVFKAGEEVEKRAYVEGAVDDMVYFVEQHMKRIQEYQDFATRMLEFLQQNRQSTPGLKSYLGALEQIARQIQLEHQRLQEKIKTLEYTHELARTSKALAQMRKPGNQAACLALGVKWRQMGGAQDYLLGQYHSLTRKLFQEAGYSCVKHPRAVAIAYEIRARCLTCLRHADGYEIWPNY